MVNRAEAKRPKMKMETKLIFISFILAVRGQSNAKETLQQFKDEVTKELEVIFQKLQKGV